MFDNSIRGGQVFIHQMRMFKQVARSAFVLSWIFGLVGAAYLNIDSFAHIDMHAAYNYWFGNIIYILDMTLNKIMSHSTELTINIGKGLGNSRLIPITQFMQISYYSGHGLKLLTTIITCFAHVLIISIATFSTIFFVWSKFGKGIKEDKCISGTTIKTAKEVAKYLKSVKKESVFKIGDMPLVKDAETRHILVAGMTGSGKTNLINTLLPQVRNQNKPAIVVDQTGEMIARYYDPDRGDIIFNPFDARSHSWDFFYDISSSNKVHGINEHLESFAKILIASADSGNNSLRKDDFWNNSAEAIFCCCVEELLKKHETTRANKATTKLTVKELRRILSTSTVDELYKLLKHTKAAHFLNTANKNTTGTIMAVLAAACKPLYFITETEKKFSMKKYFSELNKGSNAWIFLTTRPTQRRFLFPLILCIVELAASLLMSLGTDDKRRVWFVLDEFPALKTLPAILLLLSESRKYGGCILAGMQSVNQLYDNYGLYGGNVIFGQFATKFLFRSDEANMSKLVSDLFGSMEYSSQQKNTSYGAHEHRDGISYTEQKRYKPLVTASDLSSLDTLECFVQLPEPEVRIAKLKLPPMNVPKKHPEYCPFEFLGEVRTLV